MTQYEAMNCQRGEHAPRLALIGKADFRLPATSVGQIKFFSLPSNMSGVGYIVEEIKYDPVYPNPTLR
jgi:hypothetical protein